MPGSELFREAGFGGQGAAESVSAVVRHRPAPSLTNNVLGRLSSFAVRRCPYGSRAICIPFGGGFGGREQTAGCAMPDRALRNVRQYRTVTFHTFRKFASPKSSQPPGPANPVIELWWRRREPKRPASRHPATRGGQLQRDLPCRHCCQQPSTAKHCWPHAYRTHSRQAMRRRRRTPQRPIPACPRKPSDLTEPD